MWCFDHSSWACNTLCRRLFSVQMSFVGWSSCLWSSRSWKFELEDSLARRWKPNRWCLVHGQAWSRGAIVGLSEGVAGFRLVGSRGSERKTIVSVYSYRSSLSRNSAAVRLQWRDLPGSGLAPKHARQRAVERVKGLVMINPLFWSVAFFADRYLAHYVWRYCAWQELWFASGAPLVTRWEKNKQSFDCVDCPFNFTIGSWAFRGACDMKKIEPTGKQTKGVGAELWAFIWYDNFR